MTSQLLSIIWNPDKELFRIGNVAILYYSLCWCMGLLLGYLMVKKLYNDQKIKESLFEPLFIYCLVGIFVGARLGHCFFYDPAYYFGSLKHFIEIFIPIHFAQNSWAWKYVGYEGLASHGGTIGLMIALWIYVKKTKLNLMRVLDNIAIATPITACCIRLGNLMNSEIVGKATNVAWGFIFVRNGENFPRHPAQLYEAIAYLIIFFIGLYFYKKHLKKVGSGFFFGFCIATIFTFRFLIEFIKEEQGGLDQGLVIDMGQILSIPFILLGIACMIGGPWLRKIAEK